MVNRFTMRAWPRRWTIARRAAAAGTAVAAATLAGMLMLATPASAQYSLAWGDNFPGAAGSAPNPAYWGYDIGNNFGNGEIDYGTNSRANSYLDGNGDLVIETIDNGPDAPEQYTSAHLQTEGLQPVGPYGQVEAKIQTPATDGIGESFWMLGWNYAQVGWPTCGEIDIMESHGTQASQSNGTIHAVGYDDYGITSAYVNSQPLNDAFHIYGMYWFPYHIQFYVDGNIYGDIEITKLSTYCQWPFNAQFYAIDSVGVGGTVAGPPDSTSVFPTYMYTNYVHWNSYTAGPPAAPSNLTGSANSNSVSLNWTASSTSGATYNIYVNTTNSFNAGDLSTLEEWNVSGTSFTAYDLEPSTTYYFQVRAQNPGGESSPTNTFSITTSARGNAGPVYINCGGFSIGNYMRDMLNNPLCSSGIDVSSNSAPPTFNVSGLTNPAPNNVYDSYRWGPTSYSINDLNANTLYTVRLHFCEQQFDTAGARVFNVFIDGNPVLQNFDIYSTAGAENKVLIYTYTAMSDANGNLEVDIANGPANDGLISAIDVTPDTGANNLPGTPGGVTASAASTNQINVSWNAVSGATSYNVFRSLSPTFIPSSTTYAETVTGTSVTDNVLYTDTTYYYKVAAVNASGEGQASGTVNATTQSSSAGVIAGINCGGAASGAFAADQDFNGGVTNNFAPTSISETNLSGSTIPSETVVQSDREGTFSYQLTNLAVGRPITVTLYFMENYWDAAGDRVFDVTLNNNQVLTNFDIFATAGAKDVAVQKSFNTFADANGDVTISFTPSVDNAECSAILLTQGPNPPLPSPSPTAADLASTANMISWPVTDNSVYQYKLYRGTTSGGESTTPIATLPGTTYDYEDQGLTNGTTYYYKLVATNWTGSTTSAETSAVPNPWPIPGTIYAVNYNVGGEGVGYHSTATSNLGGAYRLNENVSVEPSQDTQGTQVPYDVSNASAGQWMNYTVNVAQAGSYTVSFRVSGYGGGPLYIQNSAGDNLTGDIATPDNNGWQVWSNVTATVNLPAGVQTLTYYEGGDNYNFHFMTFTYNGSATAPSAPTGLTATAGSASVALAWTASSNATSYNVYRGTTSGGESSTPIATGLTGMSYTDSTAVNGTTYYYKVAAVDSAGTSGMSNEASATPEGTPVVEIDCGGAAASPFVADTDYSGGSETSVTNTITTSQLTGTVPPQAVLQSNRYGAFTYTIPGLTAGASYPVTLYFAEEYWTAAGDRVFDVSINGTQVLTNFDIYATAGAEFAAVEKTFTATANSSGDIVITTTNVTDNAQINGIVIGSSTGSGGSAPSAPTGLTATAGSAQVALTWTASSGATSYNVYRSTTSGGEGTTAYATGITGTTYTNTGLTNGTTYYYTVAAVNASGTSAQSSQASATPEAAVPAAPTGLTATAGNAQVALSWTASTGATSYNVYRGTTSGGESATALATGITATTYTDTTVTNGTTYYYKVAAVNTSGTSAQSNEASAEPTAATGSGGVSINCGGAATGSWVADEDYSGGGADSWATTVSTSLLTGTIPPQAVLDTDREGTFTYTIPSLTAGASYPVTLYFVEQYFSAAGDRVFSVTANGTTEISNLDIYATAGGDNIAIEKSFNVAANSSGQIVLTFTPSVDQAKCGGIVVGSGAGGGSAPAAPTGLTATAGNAQVALSWTASTGATSYNVYRSTTSGGEGTTAYATGVTGTTYTNTGLTNGTTYYYTVAAVNASGTSAQSSQASATPEPVVPAAPTGLTATAGNAQVALSWTASTGATSYNVYRSTTSGGEGTTAYATGITGTTYTNTGLTNGTAYYYTVAAVNASGTSAQSSQASATPEPAVPAAPTGLTATAGNAQVALSWTASTGATSYNVYRGTTSGGESATAIATGITTTTYTNTGLTNGTTYYYKVAAVNTAGTSAESNEASAEPVAAPTVEINSGGAATGSWVADADFSGGGTDSWTATVSTSLLIGTIPPQAVLDTDREGTFTYTIPGLTANSSHTVTLYFVEQYFTASGKRVFSVTSNGTTEISNLDIYATAGGDNIAIEKTFSTTANSSGQIVLGFTASVDQAKCGGIVVD